MQRLDRSVAETYLSKSEYADVSRIEKRHTGYENTLVEGTRDLSLKSLGQFRELDKRDEGQVKAKYFW